MTTNLDVGDHYSIGSHFATGIKGTPPWMEWDSNGAEGDAELPSGYRRITKTEVDVLLGTVTTTDESVDVAPVQLPADTLAPWRCAVYSRDGAYMIADGLTGVPTIGTPQVRLTKSAPTRAVVKFALGRGADNVLSPTFNKWSDGTARAIERGMEITVEYRDEATRTLALVFRGRIFQIESGEAVTVTAYDRLMDLYQTTGQYLSHTGSTQGARSTGRTTSGSDYIFETGVPIGVLTDVDSIDRIQINGSGNTTTALGSLNDIIIHGLPTAGGLTPQAGDTITRIQTKYSAQASGITRAGTFVDNPKGYAFKVICTVYIFERVGGAFIERARGEYIDGGMNTSVAYGSVTLTVPLLDRTADITLDSPFTVTDPANTFVGLRVTTAWEWIRHMLNISLTWGPNRSTTRYTTSGVRYFKSSDGNTWVDCTADGHLPEVGVTTTHVGASISTGLATVSGTTVIIAQGNIPTGPTDTYLSTEEEGVGIIVSYYEVDKAPLAEIIKELIEAAGLNPETGTSDLGLVTFYTVVTTDYLTAIQELLGARGYGIRDSIQDAGTIALLPEHTIDETPVLSVTTDPTGADVQAIVSHNLTVHWASEKATVAYIAENATSSGLPLALETDDGLMDGSLVEILQTPLSSVMVDNTLRSHDRMAQAAGGAIRRLHVNTMEGTVVLAGYRPTLWDLTGAGIGGLPIGVDVPEYQAQGTAVPTEIVLADGLTTVRLDNIRTQDRSGVARSMGLVEGSVSNDATLLPQTVYIFGKTDGYEENQIEEGYELQSLDTIFLARPDNTVISQSDANYLRTVVDEAGYLHLLGIFPESGGTWTSVSPITVAGAVITVRKKDNPGSTYGTTVVACIDPAKYILDNQHIHVDIRIRNA